MHSSGVLPIAIKREGADNYRENAAQVFLLRIVG